MCLKIKKIILIGKEDRETGDAEEGDDTNVDVVALVDEENEMGKPQTVKYLASFFSYGSIQKLAMKNKATGDFLHGAYFHAPNMILIDRCSASLIRKVVDQLIREGEFEAIFKRAD
ncbi:MAG: hypothetical protein WA004_11710 [Saprospiraceae bacterium]